MSLFILADHLLGNTLMNPLSKLGPLDHTRNARPQRTRKRAARLERKYAPHRYFPRLEQLENRVVPALTGSTFESNDGNLIVNTSGNKDWVNAPEFKFGVDLPSGQTDNSFGQGTKEDSAVPTVVTGSIPNNKSDLTRFYVSSETGTNDHIFMYLAWERANTLGTANMDFEFNQSTALSANGVTPVRTAGDMLITFDFASGGNVVNLGLRRWTGSAWDAGTDLTAGGIAEGAVNDLTTVVDPMTGKTLAKDTFGEAALDLTAAGVFPANQCVHFGRAYLKSRSSTSFPAELPDFPPPTPVNLAHSPNISVTKTADAAVINTGDVAGFTIIVSNDSVGV